MIILHFQTHLTLGIAHCLVESVILEKKRKFGFIFPCFFAFQINKQKKQAYMKVRQRFDRMTFVSLLRSCLI